MADIGLAHNLDTLATSIHFADDFIGTMSQRASVNINLVRVNDEFWIVVKKTPGPGTKTGVGGYQTFYVPEGVEVIDAAYVLPDPSDPRGFREIPMKGQSPIAIGSGGVGAASTPELIGWDLPGVNGLIQRVPLPVNRARFDGNVDPDDHFICNACALILNLYPASDAPIINSTPVDRIAQINSVQQISTGLCRDCMPLTTGGDSEV